MINNEIADKILAAALAEKRVIDQRGHEFRASYHQPLGYHVFTVAMAVAPDHHIPFSAMIERSNDHRTIRDYLLRSAS